MKPVNKALVVLNTITLAVMLFVNYASNAGVFSSVSVGDISYKYNTLFAPAGYAFAIWGVIFLGLIAFVVNQWLLIKRGDPGQHISKTGIWLIVSNIANAAWVFAWLNESLFISVLLIVALLLSLIMLTFRLRLELDDEPVRTIFFVWWPIVIYLGWLTVATVACVSAWLVSTGWKGDPLTESTWTIIMIAIATVIFLLLIAKRNLREAAGVGIWAFVAIAFRQWNEHQNIAIAAVIAAVILTVATLRHGYLNKYYSPGEKLKRKEWDN